MNRRLITTLVAIGLVLTFCTAQADVFMKQKEHTDAVTMMGQTQPAKDEVTTTWLSTDKVRHNADANTSILMRLDESLLYILQHDKKTYMAMPLMFDLKTPEQPNAEMGITFTVTPTSESKKINTWNCKKYNLKMTMGGMGMTMTTEIWATEDLKIDSDIYAKFASAAMGANPMMAAMMENMMNEMKKIKGVQVLSTTSTQMMGQTIKSSSELVEFKEGTAPAGIFNLPGGYKEQSFMGQE